MESLEQRQLERDMLNSVILSKKVELERVDRARDELRKQIGVELAKLDPLLRHAAPVVDGAPLGARSA